jgi:hypothetical protein
VESILNGNDNDKDSEASQIHTEVDEGMNCRDLAI